MNLVFEYAIRFPDGKYYNGNSTDSRFTDRVALEESNLENKPFLYTEKGAHTKIDLYCDHWMKGATVEKLS